MSAVLVTGGGTGIGAAVARLLREAGDEVARAALPFDPRVEVRPDEAPWQASADAGADMGLL